MKIYPETASLLESQAGLFNAPEFIGADPVQFPRMFKDLRDIEAVALLTSTIAWGNRTMICRNCGRLIDMMDGEPYHFIMDNNPDGVIDDDVNIHRTFFGRNLKYFLRGLRRVFAKHGSVQGLARAEQIALSPYPAWDLASALGREFAAANDGRRDSRCVATNVEATALKRLNMALRWLVRTDGIVDLGVWDVIKPSQLYIPLDVHVGNTARALGILSRKSNDRKAAVELTGVLRTLRPEDPVYYDYALFGIGMAGGLQDK